MKNKILERPSVENVRKKLDFIINYTDVPRNNASEINYPAIKNAEKAINNLIKTFPKNTRLEDIYLKVITINALYSTNIYDTYKMAYHIYKNIPAIDDHLQEGEIGIIEKISRGHGIKGGNGVEKHFYSFSTKYCSFHNPDRYAIYDHLIQDLLIKFRNQEITISGKREQKLTYNSLRDYAKFMEVINEFKEVYNLNELNLKQIDMYLWLMGKTIL